MLPELEGRHEHDDGEDRQEEHEEEGVEYLELRLGEYFTEDERQDFQCHEHRPRVFGALPCFLSFS